MEDKLCEKYAGVYQELYELIGAENMKKIFSRFCGQQVSFPQKLYKKTYVQAYVMQHRETKSVGELSKYFNLSERRIRQLISEKMKEERFV